ncbi:hypothetical protein Vadar_016183 [Vaccinium darrowii]|uniref:Uncharacterized protein n=1 Tax=Vaccinium darrowii TaxID=229202 RepID=A0ACB7YDY9_9ERIC|nr:hypothetical protein Vadar_016183 [Vaccinium darrowii]
MLLNRCTRAKLEKDDQKLAPNDIINDCTIVFENDSVCPSQLGELHPRKRTLRHQNKAELFGYKVCRFHKILSHSNLCSPGSSNSSWSIELKSVDMTFTPFTAIVRAPWSNSPCSSSAEVSLSLFNKVMFLRLYLAGVDNVKLAPEKDSAFRNWRT